MAHVMSMAAMFADPPQHTFLRSEANKGFSQRAMAAVTPRIQKLTDELLDKVQARGSMDGFRDFLQPFAITIICDVMGVPREDVQLFLDWTFKTTLLLGGSKLTVAQAQDSMRAFEELNAHLVKLLRLRIAEPRDDMMSYLSAGVDLEKFPIEAVAGLCAELIGGANAPTGDALGNALLACLANPEQVARAQRDPSLWPSAVQELLRYDGPVVFWTRLVTQDVEIGGKQLRAGDMVYVSLAGANRDPEMFPEPDRLDFTRANAGRHLAFSLGPHYCVGAGLARIEMAILFETLFRRMPNLRLSGPINWREGTLSTRGPTTIPLAF
jgi:cytochrome P450